MVSPPAGGKDFGPAVLYVAQHKRDKSPRRIVRRSRGHRRSRTSLLRRRPTAEQDLSAIEKHAGIDAEIPADQSDNDDRSDPETALATWHAATRCADFAIILDVAAGTKIIRAHVVPF